tara:strand:+ start:417 stop:578 length:162 start_codon:yes stop_codon:yes gene_type:complete
MLLIKSVQQKHCWLGVAVCCVASICFVAFTKHDQTKRNQFVRGIAIALLRGVQ